MVKPPLKLLIINKMEFILRYKILILLFFLSCFIIWPLFMPGFFKVQDYLQVIRIYEMRQCIEALQIPCRWVANMGSGYGFPLFNYYGVFPYYIAAISSYFLGFIGAAKFIFFLPLTLGGIFMYILAKEVLGRQAAFVAAVLYLFAPYRALDIYVRGSIAEISAMTLIPLVFYFFLKLIKSGGKITFLATTFTWAIFLLNHNLMTMLFTPFLLVWIVYWLFIKRKSDGFRKTVMITLLSFILGFLLASFYILPAYFEQNLIQAENLKESEFIPNFRSHFVTVNQLFFSRFWGYGASVWGDKDGLSFQIGWPHWELAVLTICLVTFQFIRNKSLENGKKYLIYYIFFFVSVVSLLMTHNKSAFFWEWSDKLQFVQFPWRFLSIAIFSVSFLGGAVVLFIRKQLRIYFVVIITLLTIFINYKYFQPESLQYSLSDKNLLTGLTWEFYQQGALTDYLPKSAQKPNHIAPLMPHAGVNANIKNYQNKSNKFSFQAEIKEKTNIDIPVFDFPGWKVFANGLLIKHSNKGEFGTIQIRLVPGSYLISGVFENTALRLLANSLSAVGIGLILLVILL